MQTKIIIVIVALIVAIVAYKKMSKKKQTPRQKQVEGAIAQVFTVKMHHHDLIVAALEGGATESDHTDLLEDKRIAVLAIIDEMEAEFGVVFDKTGPTVERMPIILSQ